MADPSHPESADAPNNDRYSRILLAHGGGGRLMHTLIEEVILPAFGGTEAGLRHDGAVVERPPGRIAFTTDSYVVKPLFFPGGNIGELAVYGTVNDLAMCGARPTVMSVGFILEEGFNIAAFKRIVEAMAHAAQRCAVRLVTGDTKVVERGHGDGLFINTSGIGVVEVERAITPASIESSDIVLLSGDIGRHGIAVMANREGLEFETRIESDVAPLIEPVFALLAAGIEVHCLRDLTRGGFGGALIELAEAAKKPIVVEETQISVAAEVRGACEILGLDPLFVANEGRFVAVVAERDADRALGILGRMPGCEGSARVGCVRAGGDGRVSVRGSLGVERALDMPSGEQLPRIC